MAGDAGLKEAVTQVAAGVLVALHCLYIIERANAMDENRNKRLTAVFRCL
jgi:hypothetical protein